MGRLHRMELLTCVVDFVEEVNMLWSAALQFRRSPSLKASSDATLNEFVSALGQENRIDVQRSSIGGLALQQNPPYKNGFRTRE